MMPPPVNFEPTRVPTVDLVDATRVTFADTAAAPAPRPPPPTQKIYAPPVQQKIYAPPFQQKIYAPPEMVVRAQPVSAAPPAPPPREPPPPAPAPVPDQLNMLSVPDKVRTHFVAVHILWLV